MNDRANPSRASDAVPDRLGRPGSATKEAPGEKYGVSESSK
jgi:hypothetical protein